MSWFKMDVDFGQHPKILRVKTAEARMLYIGSLAYCAKYLTDGEISREALPVIARDHLVMDLETSVAELVIARLWKKTRSGYVVHSYAEHQSTKEKVRDKQEKHREAQARYRKGRDQKVIDHPVDHVIDLEEKRKEEKRNYSRPRDALWDAFVAETGQPATDDERGRLNAALKQLRKIGATPEELAVRIVEYRKRWPEMELTPQAITGNWTRLGKEAPQQNGRRTTGYRFVRGTHSGSYVADPHGTDRPPASYSLGAS